MAYLCICIVFLVAHALANNPALMEAVQNKLNGLVGKTSGYVET